MPGSVEPGATGTHRAPGRAQVRVTDAMFEANHMQAIVLVAIGLVAGLLGGLLGVGGGIIMIPAMWLLLDDAFGQNSFHLYKLAAITTSIALCIPAAARHRRARAGVPQMLVGILPLATVGVIVGVVAASYLSDQYTHWLRRAFGGFLVLVAVLDVYQRRRAALGDPALYDVCPVPARRTLIGTVVGLPAGLIAGLLGIGGGVWAVPAQRMLLGVQLRHAIANSSFMIVGVATVTALTQSLVVARMPGLHALDGWRLALWLAPGALVGGWCGAGLTHRVPTRWLHRAFHILLVLTGLRLLMLA